MQLIVNADSLKFHLEGVGFRDVSERRYLDSRIPQIKEVEKNPWVCVEGICPGG